MKVRTLFLYLIGDRQATLDVAACPKAIWVGLVFVFSAAFARDYDGADLLHEPWHLLIPVVASLGASFLLFLVVFGPLFFRREARPPFSQCYRSFLILFWMTAPLAWFYAVPYERFLSATDATVANLWTLAFVATWRVALMSRVTSVLTGRGIVPSTVLVLAFGDAVALAAIAILPKPVIADMGGIQASGSENAIHAATLLVACLGICSAPVWLALGWSILARSDQLNSVLSGSQEKRPISSGVWILAVCSILFWLPILPWTQHEQQLRWQVETLMRSGQIVEGLDLMSSHSQSDFPPHWDAPPRLIYPKEHPHIVDVMDVLLDHECAPWVRAFYLDKFVRFLGPDWIYSWELKSGVELSRIVNVLERLPEGPFIVSKEEYFIKERLKNNFEYSSGKKLTEEERRNWEKLMDLTKKEKDRRKD